MRGLTEAQLREACFDRGMGTTEASTAEMRRQLEKWLQVVDQLVVLQGQTVEPQPLKMRMAAIAAFGVASTRRSTDCQLPRLLFG